MEKYYVSITLTDNLRLNVENFAAYFADFKRAYSHFQAEKKSLKCLISTA